MEDSKITEFESNATIPSQPQSYQSSGLACYNYIKEEIETDSSMKNKKAKTAPMYSNSTENRHKLQQQLASDRRLSTETPFAQRISLDEVKKLCDENFKTNCCGRSKGVGCVYMNFTNSGGDIKYDDSYKFVRACREQVRHKNKDEMSQYVKDRWTDSFVGTKETAQGTQCEMVKESNFVRNHLLSATVSVPTCLKLVPKTLN
jgi:hypothetical protein